jgi:threonine synthase
MRDFRVTGRMPVPPAAWRHAADVFSGFRMDDEATLDEIARLNSHGYLADPHSAIAIAAARAAVDDLPAGVPVVAMATAHPAKFRDTMRAAVGREAPLPAHLADLYDRPETFSRVPADLAAIEDRVRGFVLRNAT